MFFKNVCVHDAFHLLHHRHDSKIDAYPSDTVTVGGEDDCLIVFRAKDGVEIVRRSVLIAQHVKDACFIGRQCSTR